MSQVFQVDHRVRDLVTLVKRWAGRNGINSSPDGTLSSYCLMLLVISFCQDRQPPLLPPFKELFPDLRRDLLGVKEHLFSFELMLTMFTKNKDKPALWAEMNMQLGTQNKETLLDLLIGFLVALKEQACATEKVLGQMGYEWVK